MRIKLQNSLEDQGGFLRKGESMGCQCFHFIGRTLLLWRAGHRVATSRWGFGGLLKCRQTCFNLLQRLVIRLWCHPKHEFPRTGVTTHATALVILIGPRLLCPSLSTQCPSDSLCIS